MRNNFVIPFIIVILLVLPVASSFEYTLNNVQKIKDAGYETDYARFRSSVTYTGEMCKISCEWFADSDSGTFDCLMDTCGFEFNVNAESGRGSVSDTLRVRCRLPSSWNPPCIAQDYIEQTKDYSFSYPYLGDGQCTTSNNYEDCQSAPSDCPCSSDKKCMEDISRPKDSRGCTTYCGNNKIERSYEDCNKCPDDVGKCDGQSCVKASECEGKHCVHEVCWNKPYREGDGFCDSNVGENCKTSDDCKCGPNERCSASGVCETYCGNGVCETAEQGICEADCDWCGDGDCQQGETCKQCPEDCGECKRTVEEQSAVKSLVNIKEEAQEFAKEAKKTREIINISVYSSSGLIFLVIVLWIIFKLIKSKKHLKKDSRKKERNVCKKCKAVNPKGAKFCNKCGGKL